MTDGHGFTPARRRHARQAELTGPFDGRWIRAQTQDPGALRAQLEFYRHREAMQGSSMPAGVPS
jgi:hypothetical protein